TQAQIEGQLGSNFPIVVDITAVIIFSVVSQGDVGYEYTVVGSPVIAIAGGTANVIGEISASSETVDSRSEQELSAASLALSHSRDFCVEAAIIELSAGPGR